MDTIGLIIGNGYGKGWSIGGRKCRFPAVAAPISEAGYETDAGGPQIVQLAQPKGSWLVGDDAQTYERHRLVSILDSSRYQHPSFQAMTTYALIQLDPAHGPLVIMTGMPSAWFDMGPVRSEQEQALQEAAAPWGQAEVIIKREITGVFYAYAFENGRPDPKRTQQRVGVIDIGYRDTNVALFEGGKHIHSRSVPGGMVAAYLDIGRLIARRYSLELNEHQVDAVMQQGAVQMGGRSQPLPQGSEEALLKGADTALSVGRSMWPAGGRTLDVLVVGGGGAVALGPRIRAEFPQTVVAGGDLSRCGDPPTHNGSNKMWAAEVRAAIKAADPQMAGVRGFAAAASAIAFQRRALVPA